MSRKLHGHTMRRAAALAAAACLLLPPGCAKERYRARADRETYAIVGEKSEGVPNADTAFTIDEDAAWEPLDGLARVETSDASLGLDAAAEAGAAIVPLERALHIAVKRSRTYQNRKEALYLAALTLTLERHRYTPIFSGGGDAAYETGSADGTRASGLAESLDTGREIIAGIEQVTGTPATLLRSFADLVESAGGLSGATAPETTAVREQRTTGGTRLNVDVLLRGGGRLALGLTSNFLRFTTGDARAATQSVLDGSFVQPLWRGAGRKVALERLTQAERDVLYAIREFTQFRKAFVVETCSAYYRVLQGRDAARNAWTSLENFEKNLERERAFAELGRRTVSDLGRLEQARLDSANRYVNALRDYREALDAFKIDLGLSTDTPMLLDEAELARLRAEGLKHPEIPDADAVAVALESRLDLQNAQDQVDDAARKTAVAANALGADIDFFVEGSVTSPGEDNFLELDFGRGALGAGIDLDLPFDRKAERNAYRASLIAQARAARDLALAEDNVKLEVRQAWRDLDQARRNFEVAQSSVSLNERRVEEQRLRSELGRATAQDIVDAQNDLTQSQDNLTAAVVAHTIARLEFWRNMGILYVKENGQWEEVQDGIAAAPTT